MKAIHKALKELQQFPVELKDSHYMAFLEDKKQMSACITNRISDVNDKYLMVDLQREST